MATFIVRYRVTGEWQETTVEADHREMAIEAVSNQVPEGSEILISTVTELLPSAGPTGTTGTTGTTGDTGASGASGAFASSTLGPTGAQRW